MSPVLQGALLWGFVASTLMATILQGSQSLGLSRLNMPFLIGTLFSGRRQTAMMVGFIVYIAGGWAFAFLYYWAFDLIGHGSWWLGGLLGLAHGLVLITIVLPSLPLLHPRMAYEYEGPSMQRRLEPPGRFGLNYGSRTPLTTVLAQAVYGLILGVTFPL